MSTTKDIKQKVKASSIEERVAHLQELQSQISYIESDMEYWAEEASQAEEDSTWWKTCWKITTQSSG